MMRKLINRNLRLFYAFAFPLGATALFLAIGGLMKISVWIVPVLVLIWLAYSGYMVGVEEEEDREEE